MGKEYWIAFVSSSIYSIMAAVREGLAVALILRFFNNLCIIFTSASFLSIFLKCKIKTIHLTYKKYMPYFDLESTVHSILNCHEDKRFQPEGPLLGHLNTTRTFR